MKAYGITLLRVTVGVIYLLHAYRLFRDGSGEAPTVLARAAGVQDPSVMLWVVLAVQGLGGLLLLAGIFTRPAAAANALVSAGTLVRGSGRVTVTGLEFPVLLLVATVVLLLLGSGPAALRPSK